MNANASLPESRPLAVLQDMIDRHGRLSVFALALAALLRPGRKPLRAMEKDLSDHLLRDIGFSPRGAPAKTWQHYR
jgi:hypothetical protein